MQAVILAAGLAKRLRPLTDSVPKCLLDVSGKNLLHRTMDNLLENGISEFIIVTGYKEEMIKDYLTANFKNAEIEFLSNPDYADNNNSYSLWMTKNSVKNDIILLDSDILFNKKIITKLLDTGHDNCLAVNVTKELDHEQIKVITDDKDKILEIGKPVDIKKSIGESIGIEKFSKPFMDEVFQVLDRKIIKENNVNEFYEVTFQEIINKNQDWNSIYSVDVSMYECIEIDTVEDYNKAKNLNLQF